MNSDALALFREVADHSPLEREEYYARQRVPAAIRAEVESLLQFDGETDGAVHGCVAAEITHVLNEQRRRDLALPAVLKGHPPDAIEWLSRAYDAGYRDHAFLERDPILAPLRREQRFRDLLERMRQDVAAQRATASSRGLLEIDTLLGSTPAPTAPRSSNGR